MRLIPSVRYEDPTGATHAVPVACVDTCVEGEPLIQRAVAEALALGGRGVRVEFVDEATGVCRVRRRVVV